MELATGALGTLLPKLAQLLHGEYQLQKNVRKNIEFLTKELETTQAALRVIGEVPTEQLNELVRIWARDARELSYDMEDVVDTFLVRVDGPNPPSKRSSKRFIQKMRSMLAIGKRHDIGEQVEDIKERVMELAARRDRCKVDTVNYHITSVDPRIKALYVKTTELVGIEKARKEIILELTKGDDMSSQVQKIVSIVGFGGLGKTTLAKAVYEEIESQFDCRAFVTVSRNPDIKKFLKDMLYELDKGKYGNIHSTSLDVNHLIDLVRGFISNKRYLIIIDDIWDISNWDIIKCALQDDNTGCRIITTTRKVRIAKYIGGAYEMKPLSSYSSRVLLYRRIFGNENLENCFDKELEDVSDRILKKCAGVPLAIITIASLLVSKGRNKSEWVDVYSSIGNGMENSLDAENMRKILSYSYYDLPSHLRTCLLYLSMFPEDSKIEKHRLIWLWIAEGFIQHKEQGNSLFEHGESYFNELINRSMIQPMYIGSYNIEIDGCCVHDMVLDFIRSLSSEENFVTVFTDMDKRSTQTRIRRLSLQHGNVDHGSTWYTERIAQVRSVLVFSSAVDITPALQNFKILRVLDLQDCVISNGYNLKHLCNLFHLRYLNLKETTIDLFPEEVIGNLQFLETLDLRCSVFSCLPLTVTQLKYLMCLRVYVYTRVPDEIGSLRSLEELSWLNIHEDSSGIVEALGFLTQLRVLNVALFTYKWNDKLLESLHKLQKIQDFEISDNCWTRSDPVNIDGLDTWMAPPHLRSLHIQHWSWFSTLPTWINNNPPHNLSILSIAVKELRQEDLVILGELPSLRNLDLLVDHVNLRIYGNFVVGAGSFPCLLCCRLFGFVAPVVLQQGAMPLLRTLQFGVQVREARKIAGSSGSFDFSLGNLSSLQNVYVFFQYEYASEDEVEEAIAAVRKEAEIHPNSPTLEMYNKGLRIR